MGIIDMDEKTGLIEIAKPIGVVAGITPMTNPIVTPMSKIIFALKTKNAIIIAPHPQSKRCSALAVNLIKDVVAPFGVPADLIQVIDEPSIDKTKELMEACDVVVATGGMPMVKSAYSSGKPSFGVGAGNVQVILDRNIDLEAAAEKVITGRAFDNGIICSGEQFFTYPVTDREAVFKAFPAHGAYFVTAGEKERLLNVLFPEGKINRALVGQSVKKIAGAAGIDLPEGIRVIVAEATTTMTGDKEETTYKATGEEYAVTPPETIEVDGVTFRLKRVLPAGDKFKNTVEEKGLVKEGVTTIVYQYVMQIDAPKVEVPEFDGGVVPLDPPTVEKPELKIPEQPTPAPTPKPESKPEPKPETPQAVTPADNGDNNGNNNGTPTTPAQPAAPSTPQYMDGQRELPNTGTEDNASLAALGLLGVLSGFGLVARKKKED